MNAGPLRIFVPLALLAAAGIAFALHAEWGTLSVAGWSDIALLCPIGAATTMLAGGEVTLRAVISLAVALAGMVLLGRAFCAWACPVPLLSRLRAVIARRLPRRLVPARKEGGAAREEGIVKDGAPSASRYFVLGAVLLSAAVFGFPVFCLVCPVGLAFALVFALVSLAGGADVGWAVVVIPAVLAAETLLMRRWCSHLCPIGALMSLVARLNRTWRPSCDDSKCVETTLGHGCAQCAKACRWGLDPRRPAKGAPRSECTKCRACADSCPADAITFPLIDPPAK